MTSLSSDSVQESNMRHAGAGHHISPEEYEVNLPEVLKEFYELSATLQCVQHYGVYGKGMEKKQYGLGLGDKWLLAGTEKTTWSEYVEEL